MGRTSSERAWQRRCKKATVWTYWLRCSICVRGLQALFGRRPWAIRCRNRSRCRLKERVFRTPSRFRQAF